MPMRGAMIVVAAAFGIAWMSAPAVAQELPGVHAGAVELSAQSRRNGRRPPRITVRPERPALSPPGYGTDEDLSAWKRDCVPVFEERWIPQWGGRVLYASQRCRWVRE
jgi:hypothetical protein